MKKFLLIGGIASLFITGCCCKPAKITCDGNSDMSCETTPSSSPVQTNLPPAPVKSQQEITKVQKSKKSLCFIQNGINNRCILRIEATGIGVVPSNMESISQAKAMARRAAIVDAYRNLAEKLYGIKINGRDTVKNMILQSSTVRSYVSGLIRGASIEDEEYKNGTYKVVLYLKLDPNRWNQVLSQSGLL